MAKKKEESSTNEKQNFLIVCLGASAGGLEAFKQFFQNMPPNTGMAFIVVQHLDPAHKSMLSELLRNYTKMKVLEVTDNTKVVSNTVYTIPPNRNMGILNGTLHLLLPDQARGARRTIDYFLRSLSEDQKEKAVGIILSGTGTEGANGLKAIKGEGGLALVQDMASAKYDGMPRTVIAANAADAILPPDKMPAYLVGYMKKRKIKPIVEQAEESPVQNVLEKIFLLLRDHTGNNFSHYKKSTINRRIDKRMAINQIAQLDTYLKYLRQTPEEINLLFKELLIGVTSFFRDEEVFRLLENKIIPQLIEGKRTGETIRVWVPGCSTGEEAYSLAILFDEALKKLKKKIDLQIFATDIDEEAISLARLATYPDSIAADMNRRRLQNYFITENHFCKVKKEIRDKVVFAEQNLISDPPFSRLDLISCRNLLIYLNVEAQNRVFPIFHYSLNPEGVLLLGTSESIGKFSNLFTTVDRKNKVFLRKSGIPSFRLDVDFTNTGHTAHISSITKPGLRPKNPIFKATDFAEKLLLLSYVPACVIIDEKNNALYFHADTGKYLQPSPGEASLNVIDMARTGLKGKLRMAINVVRKTKKVVIHHNVKVKTNGEYQSIDLRVKPLDHPDAREQLILVLFEDAVALKQSHIEPQIKDEGDKDHILELEHELASAREYLKTTVEELEVSNEELKSANEELQSANEELQSTNEELETSKEELQSVNEELITVNTELQNKIDELAHAHEDMANLLASTEIGTIFLGNQLEIKRYTPSITKVVSLIPTDIGRPIKHLSTNLLYNELEKDARKVLNELTAVKKMVKSESGIWYHMQITPYWTTDQVIDGVVMTFVDISEEKRMEEQLKTSNEHLNLALEALEAVPYICTMKEGLQFLFVGEGAEKMLGFRPHEFINNTNFWIDRIHRDDKTTVLKSLQEITTQGHTNYEFRWKIADGEYQTLRNHLRLVKSPVKQDEDYIVGIWQDNSGLLK